VVKQIFQTLRELARNGMTIFLVEQNAHHALKLSDRGYVMVNGQIRLSGSGEELLGNQEVRKAYLGGCDWQISGTKKPPFGGFTTLLIALIILCFPW
jgi:ABC-type lipopolysaccharide export system ATPase subunit